MKATRSYIPRPEMQATEHVLTVVIDGVAYRYTHVITIEAYSGLDPKSALAFIDSQLWQGMMHTIEHNLRKNLTHA